MTTPDDTRAPDVELIALKLADLANEGYMFRGRYPNHGPSRDRYRDEATAVLAALRDSGWVDPEEASVWRVIKDRAIEQRDEAQRSADYYREAAVERGKLLEQAEAKRDALLPVAEAAKRLARGTERPDLPAAELSQLLIGVHAAVDTWESREQTKIAGSTDGP